MLFPAPMHRGGPGPDCSRRLRGSLIEREKSAHDSLCWGHSKFAPFTISETRSCRGTAESGNEKAGEGGEETFQKIPTNLFLHCANKTERRISRTPDLSFIFALASRHVTSYYKWYQKKKRKKSEKKQRIQALTESKQALWSTAMQAKCVIIPYTRFAD